MRSKGDDSKDWTMEENDRFGLWIWGVAQIIDVAIGAQATDDGGAGWSIQGLALGADGDFAIVADADAGLLAPDKGPPRTIRDGAQDGIFCGLGLGLRWCPVRGGFRADWRGSGVGRAAG